MTRYAPGTPCWADLGSPDLAESQRFYAGVFGWTAQTAPEPEAMGYTTFFRDGKAVAAVGPLMDEAQPPTWTTYFATDDADAAAQRVDSAGGKILLAPMAVMDFGRMAIFLDPVGAAFAVWQAGTMEGADVVGEFGALGWFELLTRDVEASKTFYTTILGLTPRDVEFGPSTYTLWEQDGASVAGMMPMEGDQWPAEVPPHWMIYFAVEDCDGAARRAGELGGTVPVPPMDTPAGRMAVISDPHGAAFSIIVPNPDFQP